MHFAAQADADVRVIRILLRVGADPLLRNKNEHTPLHVSARHATSGDAIAAMLIYGAKVDARIGSERDWLGRRTGTTALHLATRNAGQRNVAAVLLLGGADAKARDRGIGRTPLHHAAVSRDTAMVGLLLRSGADAAGKDNGGNTPLHLLAATVRSIYLIDLLLIYGGSVDAGNDAGITPFMLAAAYNENEDVVQRMLDASEDPCETDDEGRSALSNALQNPAIVSTDVYWQLFQLCTGED